ncbi:MAG: phosphopantetheine-binding protein [Nitrospira sp.]|nr:phosphopantetheine-binding protein [Nitrospira sp.]
MRDVGAEIKRFILTEVAAELNLERLEDNEPLIESGIVNSLGILKIMGFLDESFGIDLSSDQVKLENFKDVDTIRNLVECQNEKGN